MMRWLCRWLDEACHAIVMLTQAGYATPRLMERASKIEQAKKREEKQRAT